MDRSEMTGVAADMLASVPLFAALSDADRAALMDAMEPRKYADGAALMVQYDPGDGLYILHSGTVRVGRRLPGGGFADTALLGPGSVIGEMALVGRGGRRSATVLADGPVETLFLPGTAFRAALGQLRPASLAMQRALGAELTVRVANKARDIAAQLAAEPQAFTPRVAPRQPVPPAEAGFDPAAFIAKLPLAATLDATQRAALIGAGQHRSVARGERVDASDNVWLVVRGALRSDLPLQGGDYQLEVLGPGRLAGLARQASGLTATEASLLIGWDEATFRTKLDRNDALAMALGAAINADLVVSLDGLDGVEARIAAMQRAVASEV
jgi:CRP/FNR family transcriptional regulator, cyclic AMP receptor protein